MPSSPDKHHEGRGIPGGPDWPCANCSHPRRDHTPNPDAPGCTRGCNVIGCECPRYRAHKDIWSSRDEFDEATMTAAFERAKPTGVARLLWVMGRETGNCREWFRAGFIAAYDAAPGGEAEGLREAVKTAMHCGLGCKTCNANRSRALSEHPEPPLTAEQRRRRLIDRPEVQHPETPKRTDFSRASDDFPPLVEHRETGEREARSVGACTCGWESEPRVNRAVIRTDFEEHKRTTIRFGAHTLAIELEDFSEPLQDGGERSVRDELRAAAVEWERTRQECMPCEREFFDFLGDWLESPNERFSRLAEDGEEREPAFTITRIRSILEAEAIGSNRAESIVRQIVAHLPAEHPHQDVEHISHAQHARVIEAMADEEQRRKSAEREAERMREALEKIADPHSHPSADVLKSMASVALASSPDTTQVGSEQGAPNKSAQELGSPDEGGER